VIFIYDYRRKFLEPMNSFLIQTYYVECSLVTLIVLAELPTICSVQFSGVQILAEVCLQQHSALFFCGKNLH